MFKSELIGFFGSVTKAARALGVSKSTISQWKNEVPWQYALLAEKVSDGALRYDQAFYKR